MITDVKKAPGGIFVSIYPSNLKNKEGKQLGKFIGKVKKKTLSTEQLILNAQDKNVLLDSNALLYAAQILADEVNDALSKGFAVDLLGFGTLGFSLDGNFEKAVSASEIKEHLKLSFSPSKQAEKTLSNIQPRNITIKNSITRISEVKSLINDSFNEHVLYQNRPFRITGNGLKTGGEVCGIFLVPCTEENVYAPRSEWIPLPDPYVNTPKKLETFLPDTFTVSYDGEENEEEPLFCIAVVTSLNPNGRERADCVEAFSSPFYVRKMQ